MSPKCFELSNENLIMKESLNTSSSTLHFGIRKLGCLALRRL